jgi:hypothetical protein
MIALTAASAVAQVQEQPPPPAAPPAMPPADQAAAAPMPPPPPAPMPPPPPMARAPEPEIDRGPSDFNPDVRRWAIGYAGISQVPVGSTTGGGTLTVPAIGIRYWTSPTVGVDVAFGIGYAGGSTDAGGVSTDKDSVTGFIVQGGVPIALSTHRHVSFQIMPLVSVAHGSTTIGTGTTATDLSGTRLDVGARIGFEVFFGFIGIPELALSATVGVQIEYLKNTQSVGGIDASDTTYALTTTVQNNPWDIFAGGVAARYYF